MKVALVGYGKMGRAIEAAAGARGHACVAVLGRGDVIGKETLGRAEVAFEFTEPSAAAGNVRALNECGLAVVSGTTGWVLSAELRRVLEASEHGVVLAPNFSLGVQLFYRLVGEARRLARAAGDYDAWIHEVHHREKRDAPSGTATRIGRLLFGDAADARIVSTRAGSEPGRHTVGFDGRYDAMTLEHRARGREGFADGALVAAEWVVGHRGLHGFDEIVEEILQ